MSAPTILSVSPSPNQADVVLGQPIEILFDQPIDTASLSTKTFALIGPGQASIVDAENLIRKDGQLQTGREYVTGAFAFPAPETGQEQNQKVVFTPSRPLRPNVSYTVLIVGRASLVAQSYVQNPGGESLATSYQYTFKTGELNAATPPSVSPLRPVNAWEKPKLASADILVRPRKVVGNDLTQEIELVFPGPIDPASINLAEIVVAGEPFLNDPGTEIPSSTAEVRLEGNRLIVTVHWGVEPEQLPLLASMYPQPGESGPAPDASDYGWLEPENNSWIRPA